jgi:glutamine synthetase
LLFSAAVVLRNNADSGRRDESRVSAPSGGGQARLVFLGIFNAWKLRQLAVGQPLTVDVRVSFFRVISKREPKMTKCKLEYIWLDGYKPVPNLRGKTQLKDYDSFPTLEQLPLWGFDGSSTQQAEGHSSDCVLKPVAVYPDGARTNGALVMCEVMMPDGTPHPSNMRATILDDPGAWFGFEQEYFFYKDGRPLGFPSTGYPAPQGPYYTGVGYKNVGDIARKMVEEHLDLCIFAGINHEGINAEVAKGQWEFQIFGKGSKKAADEMWMARYLLERLAEKYGVDVQYHCKPLGDTDWNGSGMHANFSTTYLRETGGKAYFEALMEAFKAAKDDHIAVYGPDNHMRLTGKHETAAIIDFTYGVADRGASIRVPHSFVKNDYKGYLEDRRPNSQGDPYQIASQILKTIDSVPTEAKKSVAA